MRPLDRRARRLLGAYGDDRGTRLHMALRWSMAPLAAIGESVPRSGSVLDVGCGPGLLDLYLADECPTRRMHGVDVDGRKISAATAAAERAGLGDRVGFETVDAAWTPKGAWDAVLVIDVLYLLGEERALALVGALAGAVAPGGRLVIKEMSDRPPWKHHWNLAQERLARRSGLTRGETIEVVTPAALRPTLEERGFSVAVRRIDRGYLHPHELLVAGRAP